MNEPLPPQVFDRARKLRALAEKGVDGEAVLAASRYAELLATHGLTDEDVVAGRRLPRPGEPGWAAALRAKHRDPVASLAAVVQHAECIQRGLSTVEEAIEGEPYQKHVAPLLKALRQLARDCKTLAECSAATTSGGMGPATVFTYSTNPFGRAFGGSTGSR